VVAVSAEILTVPLAVPVAVSVTSPPAKVIVSAPP